MQPTWLFEADAFGESAEPIRQEIRRQGMDCRVVRQDLLAAGLGGVPGPGANVICCGSFPLVHYVRTHHAWTPGVWCNAEQLTCAAYYPHFREFLLNAEHDILSSRDAVARRDELFERFGLGGRVFIRPSGCEKTFTGCAVERDRFTDVLGPARYDPTTQVVVAKARPIRYEWRLVVAGTEIVGGSRYFTRGQLDVAAGIPATVASFATEVLRRVTWRPDRIFMLDVCESEGELHVLEIGGFSCCALYACDPARVVSYAGALARQVWSESPG